MYPPVLKPSSSANSIQIPHDRQCCAVTLLASYCDAIYEEMDASIWTKDVYCPRGIKPKDPKRFYRIEQV